MKRPSFQFYPGDWLHDAALRMCSIQARGLWMDMICYMHQSSPYGHLMVNGKEITPNQLARMVGEAAEGVSRWLMELEDSGVLSYNDDGIIYSKRMVRDETLRNARAAGGKEGGNPKLTSGYNKPGFLYCFLRASDGHVKIGISQHPGKRVYKVRMQYPGDEIAVADTVYVSDMGAEEARLHKLFSDCKSGEWFALSDQQKATLNNEFVHLKEKIKGNTKEKPTPSSSTSSSSSTGTDVPVTPRASRLDKEWVLPVDWAAWARAERPDLDVDDVAARFKDYWVAKPGKDGCKLDWLATWRNWVRNSKQGLRRAASAHSGFAGTDYRKGINDDGSFE